MSRIFNLIITFFVFWIGSTYFQEYIQIEDTKTLILASVLMFVITIIFAWVMLISVGLIMVGVGVITTPILILAAFVLTPIKLLLLDAYLPGFEINGFWTYVIITAVLSLFSVSTKKTTTRES